MTGVVRELHRNRRADGPPTSGAARLPDGFGIALDDSARELEPGTWFGGVPARITRLSDAGRRALDELRTGPVAGPTAGRLARTLVDSGLAHPVPPAAAGPFDLTVLVPVLDRPEALGRCLAALGREHPVVVVDDGSRDAAAIARVAAAHGARLIRRDVNGGPAAARNTGLVAVTTGFVALLDSDCVPPAGWLAPLVAHLADPLVAAAAPRIAAIADDTWAGRYTRVRGSLDLGPRPSRVAPKSRVSYVPTAALVARRAALLDVAGGTGAFEASMRVGEDVDLVWRLDAAGWRVRYAPAVRVSHQEPGTWPGLLRRRFSYGTSAAPLALRHPGAGAPLVIHPWLGVTVAALLARRPGLAAGGYAMSVAAMSRRLRTAGLPTRGTARSMAGAVRQTWLGVGRYLTQLAAPAVAAAAVLPGSRGRRLAAASLLLGPPLTSWAAHRDSLDPIRYTAAHLADEIAYGAGVWAGCRTHRTIAPLRPAIARPARRRTTRGDRT
ncbi:MAG TPA: mycofactocin biosynthesis glycosyltransferase MftF [Jatrophihabitans sp.]|uniref:mycofactocin biosynthesis glycosyltransferase MftF n=1 Tax=Jatrophihabitans sp. TaxID=1932789 RepID=UPI002DF83CD7|nr:mycofactocin biosynthesis glycosyltransferase MftF [Jatrophihabitans sp.]HEV7205364.1 mycofactocin biosynthesis glycosyltransferase MftF [Jatrophihabitans sp.]